MTRRFPIRRRGWWTAAGLLLVAMAGTIVLTAAASYQQAAERQRTQLADVANEIHTAIAQDLQRANDALDLVRSEVPSFVGGHLPQGAWGARLAAIVRQTPGVRTMLVLDADGKVISSNRPELMGNVFKGSERFQTISQSPDPRMLHMSAPFVTPLGNFTVSLGKVLQGEQGRFAGYVLAIVDPKHLTSALERAVFADDVNVSLVHIDGRVVIRVPDNEDVVGMDLSKSPAAMIWTFVRGGQSQDVVLGATATTGRESFVAFRRIAPTVAPVEKQLVLTVARDAAAVFAPWRASLIWKGVLFVLVGVAVCAWLWRMEHAPPPAT
ncbi:cache domain-containing protein [Hydrogenophaga sp. OTU3427]|uniref:cache domain-containing protein n=1 Tax=Hydrogenophaga sp. OTU3427 TaxID=3043856 RepID=UPI00313E2CFF